MKNEIARAVTHTHPSNHRSFYISYWMQWFVKFSNFLSFCLLFLFHDWHTVICFLVKSFTMNVDFILCRSSDILFDEMTFIRGFCVFANLIRKWWTIFLIYMQNISEIQCNSYAMTIKLVLMLLVSFLFNFDDLF